MKKQSLWISVVFISSLLLSACAVGQDLSAVSKLGNDFMTGLRDGQYQQTWAMLTSALQTEIGGYDAWVTFATPRTFDKWSFSNTQIQNNQGQLDGECSIGTDTYTITLVMDKVGTDWKISGINITAK
jgi:predicted small secreted protein